MANFEAPGNFFKQKPLTSEEYYLGVIVSRLHKCKSMKNKNKKRKYNYLIGSDAKKKLELIIQTSLVQIIL